MRIPALVLSLLVVGCVTGPSRADNGLRDPGPDAGIPGDGGSGSQTTFSVRVDEPRCAETPMDERAKEKCVCSWGRRCVCRGTMTVEVSRCVVSTGIDRIEGEPRIRLSDGGLVAPIGILTHQQELFETAVIRRGETTEICGTRLDCPP